MTSKQVLGSLKSSNIVKMDIESQVRHKHEKEPRKISVSKLHKYIYSTLEQLNSMDFVQYQQDCREMFKNRIKKKKYYKKLYKASKAPNEQIFNDVILCIKKNKLPKPVRDIEDYILYRYWMGYFWDERKKKVLQMASKKSKKKPESKDKDVNVNIDDLSVSDLETSIVTSGSNGELKPSRELNRLFEKIIVDKIKDDFVVHVRKKIKPMFGPDLTHITMFESRPEVTWDEKEDERLYITDIFDKKYLPLIKPILEREGIFNVQMEFDVCIVTKCEECGHEMFLWEGVQCSKCDSDY